MTSVAFCPGHITALFYAPDAGPTVRSTGSRGAGVCISEGVTATVSAARGKATTIAPMGDTRLPPVTASALAEYLSLAEEAYELDLELAFAMPVGQGFGMSGAMTFAALMASEAELGLVEGDVDALLALAHAAEVGFSTGLGDVVAQARGGIDVRVREGLPPDGEVLIRHQEAELLVAWTDEPLHTHSVINDAVARQRLMAACRPKLEALEGVADLDWLLDQGWAFARGAGLASEAVTEMVALCSRYGRASQVMLGNSVFAAGNLADMESDLLDGGFHIKVVDVDNQGVRVLI